MCDINNNPLSAKLGLSAKSGCDTGGQGYLCDRYTPTPTGDDLAYGFAAMASGNCCKCFELEWTSGGARGKKMVVQAIDVTSGGGGGGNAATTTGSTDIVILTPGGGTGSHDAGCRAQYGSSW